MSIIPKKFMLGGTTINVSFIDVNIETNRLGECSIPHGTLSIVNSLHHEPVTQDSKEWSFLHELTHLILDSMGREDLSSDETFVECFSNFLHQYFKTKEE